MMKRLSKQIITFMLGLLLSATAQATTVLPLSLERMSKSAELIFYGKAISNEVKIDEVSGHTATFTTFEVIELIKGNADATHTIKQMGGQLPDSDITHKVHGVPRFTVGEKYVVFMPQESRLGFASPLGLSQGRFIVSEQNGVSSVNNGRTARTSLTSAAKPDTEITSRKQPSTPLAEFLTTVRELSAE